MNAYAWLVVVAVGVAAIAVAVEPIARVFAQAVSTLGGL